MAENNFSVVKLRYGSVKKEEDMVRYVTTTYNMTINVCFAGNNQTYTPSHPPSDSEPNETCL